MAVCGPAQAQMTVYATDGLSRIRPHDEPRDASSIAISAARNEYEPFQIVVHAGKDDLESVNARATALRARDGSTIGAANIVFYREQYVHVTQMSPRSMEGEGWYPDALLPFVNTSPVIKGARARFTGAPFDVDDNNNQPLWVDVYVPKGTRPGLYSGKITVTAANQKSAEIAVQLTVWNITLPDTPSLRSNFGKLGTDIATAHGVVMNSVEFAKPEWEYGAALAAHRISPIIPNMLYPKVHKDGTIDPARTDKRLKDWINTFHVTGFPLRLLGDDPAGKDRAKNVTHLRAMYAYLKANGWEKMAYEYIADEPNSAEAYEQVRRRAKLIHDAQPGIKVMAAEQPTPQDPGWGTLVGSVDIWVPLWVLWDDNVIAQREQAGDEVWSYTALCQGHKGKDTPYWEIDFPLLNFRIPMWISWRYRLSGILYWSPVWWGVTPDVWTNPGTYKVGHDVFNGDGALLYPGTAAGIDGPIVSMRLKEIREGFEDYEYLKLLADRGDRAFVDQVVQKIARSWTDWDAHPQALYDARAAIAQRLTATK
jgi:hypothetical protein